MMLLDEFLFVFAKSIPRYDVCGRDNTNATMNTNDSVNSSKPSNIKLKRKVLSIKDRENESRL